MIAPKKNPPKPHTFNYQLKVTLIHSKPSIWRRFHVPDNLKLSRLHGVLQVVMGWTDSHLHQFRVGHDLYSLPRDGDFADSDYRDESRYTLADIAVCDKDKFIYEYDFGDCWEHEVLVEALLSPDLEERMAVCVDGKNACPPEDCGGIPGYLYLVDAISNPKTERHYEILEWLGDGFEPKHFDLEQVNKRLKRMKV
jgi:hypothetical protein